MKKYFKEILYLISIVFFSSISATTFSQVLLDADGPGDTYELINSVLAPGYNVIETPDCAHPEFGRHIDEVMDEDLGIYVFQFHIHVTPDNDRCKNFDRQRNEIKTYDKSPSNLKAVEGETVEYIWKFKLDSAFQPSTSFTHIHQLKAVGGSEDSMPLITLTPRKGSTNSLQIRYAKNTSQTTIRQVALAPFLGEWLEVKEKVLFGEEGTYEIQIKRVSDGEILLDFSRTSIRMWKTGASFIRPKWGIYRSLNVPTDLRDEIVLFANFSIEEKELTSVDPDIQQLSESFKIFPNPASKTINLELFQTDSEDVQMSIYNMNGQVLKKLSINHRTRSSLIKEIDVSDLPDGLYIVKLSSSNFHKSQTLSISR